MNLFGSFEQARINIARQVWIIVILFLVTSFLLSCDKLPSSQDYEKLFYKKVDVALFEETLLKSKPSLEEINVNQLASKNDLCIRCHNPTALRIRTPFRYSHLLHTKERGLLCVTCHPVRGHQSIPPVSRQVCIECHKKKRLKKPF